MNTVEMIFLGGLQKMFMFHEPVGFCPNIFTRPAADRRVWSTFEEFCLFICLSVTPVFSMIEWSVIKLY